MSTAPIARHPLDPRGRGAHLPADPDVLVSRERLTRLADWMISYWSASRGPRGYIYAVQPRDGGPVKIGMTHDPLSRLAGLQDGNPHRLVIRAIMLGWGDTERRIHRLWKDHRLRGEWFDHEHAAALIAFVRGAGIAQVSAFEEGETNTSFLANTLPFARP